MKQETMKQSFQNWMRKQTFGKREKYYSRITTHSYSKAIDKISRHYSENEGENTDIYTVKSGMHLRNIASLYDIGGKYEDFGHYGNGTNRAAIKQYVKFREASRKSASVEKTLKFFSQKKNHNCLFLATMEKIDYSDDIELGDVFCVKNELAEQWADKGNSQDWTLFGYPAGWTLMEVKEIMREAMGVELPGLFSDYHNYPCPYIVPLKRFAQMEAYKLIELTPIK